MYIRKTILSAKIMYLVWLRTYFCPFSLPPGHLCLFWCLTKCMKWAWKTPKCHLSRTHLDQSASYLLSFDFPVTRLGLIGFWLDLNQHPSRSATFEVHRNLKLAHSSLFKLNMKLLFLLAFTLLAVNVFSAPTNEEEDGKLDTLFQSIKDLLLGLKHICSFSPIICSFVAVSKTTRNCLSQILYKFFKRCCKTKFQTDHIRWNRSFYWTSAHWYQLVL